MKLKVWTSQEEQRFKQLDLNFKPSNKLALSHFGFNFSPFGDKLRLSLEGIGKLNSQLNVTCEPL